MCCLWLRTGQESTIHPPVAQHADDVVCFVVPVSQLILHLVRQLPAICVFPTEEVRKQALVCQAGLYGIIHGCQLHADSRPNTKVLLVVGLFNDRAAVLVLHVRHGTEVLLASVAQLAYTGLRAALA